MTPVRGQSLPKEAVRFLATTLIAGLLFYISLACLMDIAAARPYPEWLRPFANEYPVVTLALWELFVKVPVIVALSSAWSLILSQLCSTRMLAAGIATLIFALIFALLVASRVSPVVDAPILQTAARYLLPGYILQAPTFLALYLSLPIACWCLQRRRNS